MRKGVLLENDRVEWLDQEGIRPYVYVRPENRIQTPGERLKLDWFKDLDPVYINPLEMHQVEFGNQILDFEAQAFGPSNMVMPRWVFYDCAVTPGFVAGFAIHRDKISKELKALLPFVRDHEWIPLSLFIIIPTMSEDAEWVAHNLCTVNSMLPKDKRMYGLGFLSKAFGLWYANVKTCCGFTQWGNPAMRLHSYYGAFEILTAYTPIHSFARTLTYRVELESSQWKNFFTKSPLDGFDKRFKPTHMEVDPKNDDSLKAVQKDLENKKGPYFLKSHQVLTQSLNEPLGLYRPI